MIKNFRHKQWVPTDEETLRKSAALQATNHSGLYVLMGDGKRPEAAVAYQEESSGALVGARNKRTLRGLIDALSIY